MRYIACLRDMMTSARDRGSVVRRNEARVEAVRSVGLLMVEEIDPVEVVEDVGVDLTGPRLPALMTRFPSDQSL